MREIRNIQGYKQYMKHLSDISDKWITTIEYILQIIRNAYTDKMSNFDNIPFIDANLSEQIKYKINVFLHGTFESISSDIIQRIEQYKCDSRNNPHYEISKSESVKELEKIIRLCDDGLKKNTLTQIKKICKKMIDSMYNMSMLNKFRKKVTDNVKEYFSIKIKELNGDFASIMKQKSIH